MNSSQLIKSLLSSTKTIKKDIGKTTFSAANKKVLKNLSEFQQTSKDTDGLINRMNSFVSKGSPFNKQAALEQIREEAFRDEMEKAAYEVQSYYRSGNKIINRLDSNKNLYKSAPDQYGHYSKENELKQGTKEYDYASNYLSKQDSDMANRKKQHTAKLMKTYLAAGGVGAGIAGAGLLATKFLAKRIK